MVLPAPARVPMHLLVWLVEREQLGELHKTIAPDATWYPPAEHDMIRVEIQELLTVLGWRDRYGELEREVIASLRVLCQPVSEFYGWITRSENTFGVLAGKIGKEAVLAASQPDSTVWLTNINSGQLAARLVAQTPNVQPRRGKPFTVSPAEVKATNRSGRVRTPTGVGVRRASPEARLAQRLAALPVTGYGELSVARRDQWGHRHRCEQPFRYADTNEGRIATLVTVVNGEPHVRVEPTDRAGMVRHLTEMERSLPI